MKKKEQIRELMKNFKDTVNSLEAFGKSFEKVMDGIEELLPEDLAKEMEKEAKELGIEF